MFVKCRKIIISYEMSESVLKFFKNLEFHDFHQNAYYYNFTDISICTNCLWQNRSDYKSKLKAIVSVYKSKYFFLTKVYCTTNSNLLADLKGNRNKQIVIYYPQRLWWLQHIKFESISYKFIWIVLLVLILYIESLNGYNTIVFFCAKRKAFIHLGLLRPSVTGNYFR